MDLGLVAQARHHLGGVSVFLVGMMGCGKSTTGKALARQLGYRFCDTDQLIGQVTGRTIPHLFAAEGRRGFAGGNPGCWRRFPVIPVWWWRPGAAV